MNILITGAFGFVGTNLSNALSATGKHRLTALDISKPPTHCYTAFNTWAELDKLSGEPLDAIIHLAGKAHDTKNSMTPGMQKRSELYDVGGINPERNDSGPKTSSAQSYFEINLGLTQKIFDHFLQSEARKFFFFSSVKAAADTVKGEFLTEDVVPQPIGPYGHSKMKAEEFILSKRHEYEAKGKQVYILRPCMIHGPGNKGNLNLLYHFVKQGIPWPLGAFDNKRSFASIDNVIFILKELISKDIPSGIYQIADDQPISTNELIKLMSEVMGKKTRIWKIPSSIVHSVSTLGDWLHLPINSERMKKLTETYVVSNMKIKKALAIDSLPIDAYDGLIKTFKSF
ncbi:MAG: NAD-dependent epimerase/dehydratase family protein [Bacteroidales bacterium]|nr:NAD-dependent epimerase/dehydratase family protein [Bacteroidales bacterium]